jgi:hypothetical protein
MLNPAFRQGQKTAGTLNSRFELNLIAGIRRQNHRMKDFNGGIRLGDVIDTNALIGKPGHRDLLQARSGLIGYMVLMQR